MTSNELPSGSTEQPSTPEEQVFDYTILSHKNQIFVQQRTKEIKSLMRRTVQDIIDLGQKLLEVKEQLGHGHFVIWLRAEFDWGEWTARKFIQVARQFKTVNFTDLSIAISALYVLASSSTPGDARKEVLERATQGEAISNTKAKAIVTRHKEAAKHKASKQVTVEVPAETVVRHSSTPAESSLASQPVEAERAAVVEKFEDSHLEKKEVLAHFQVSNCSHDMAPAANNGDCPLKDQSETEINSLIGVGNLIYLTDFGQQEHKCLGKVAEVKEVTATEVEVVIKISLQPSTVGLRNALDVEDCKHNR